VESRRANCAQVFATFVSVKSVPVSNRRSCSHRAVGGETDIVSKEMYTFEDRITSRKPSAEATRGVPGVHRTRDATAPAAGEAVLHRADVSANAAEGPLPGSFIRLARKCSGTDAPAIDAESSRW